MIMRPARKAAMPRLLPPCLQFAHPRHLVAIAWLALASNAAAAPEFRASGRLTFGSSYRLEAADPNLLNSVNAAAAGLSGQAAGGANADDANTNFRRHDATSTVLKGYLELDAAEGASAALLRVKAWYDYALARQPRAWGNSANGYTAGAPLSDRGAPELSRFSGITLSEAWLQHSAELDGMRLLGRLGRQSLDWGTRIGFGGGLEILNPKDFPALRRPGAVPQETKVAPPMLFARLDAASGFGMEGYYQPGFRPSALDMCGTFWSLNDYLTEGCNQVYAGPPAGSDRARAQSGAYLKRSPAPNRPQGGEHGLALSWKSAALATDFGLYYARYAGRTVTPGLVKSRRAGPPLIAGDPDGKNMTYFTEYVDDIALYAITFAHRRGATGFYGELDYRPKQPLQMGPGDVLGAFLSSTSPSLLRAEANALAPGAVYHAYDRYAASQLVLGVQHDWSAGAAWSASAETVAKHVAGLPDPALRRYGRADIFGLGPIKGACAVTTSNPARQCSQDGYVSSNAAAYRLRLDLRYSALRPGLDCGASLVFVHDVKGWSGDNLVNQGRKSANLALRFEYRQRYVAELVYTPVWGGAYNPLADRDQLALAAGIKF